MGDILRSVDCQLQPSAPALLPPPRRTKLISSPLHHLPLKRDTNRYLPQQTEESVAGTSIFSKTHFVKGIPTICYVLIMIAVVLTATVSPEVQTDTGQVTALHKLSHWLEEKGLSGDTSDVVCIVTYDT